MLDDEEFVKAVEEISTQMLVSGNEGALVYRWIGRHGTRIDGHGDFDIYARKVLRYCLRYGWIENPALLSTLLTRAAEGGLTPFAARMPAIATRIDKAKPKAADFFRGGTAWETCHLSLNLPFLNRDITRVAFEHFFNPLARKPQCARVLVVNGPPGGGKTFTGAFLRLLVGLHNEHDVAEADFAALKGGPPLTPDVLAKYLAGQMGTDTARAESEISNLADKGLPERWVQNIAIWLAGEANRTGKTWHLLLDNFHLSGVPNATLIFIEQLAGALAGKPLAWDVLEPEMGAPLRLVLLGYKGSMPEGNPLVRVEEIKAIERADLERHFRRYYAYKQWPLEQAKVSDLLDGIEAVRPSLFPPQPPPASAVGTPPEAPRWRMDELAEVVLRICKDLEQEAGGVPVTPGAPGERV